MTIREIRPDARLLHDLGMDGDDAIIFFSMLEEEFGTDLRPLKARWGEHFGSEGISLAGWFALALTVLAGFGMARATNVGHPLIWTVLIAGVWLLGFGGRPLRGPRMIAITVEDVLASVEAGQWIRSYQGSVRWDRKGIFWGGSS